MVSPQAAGVAGAVGILDKSLIRPRTEVTVTHSLRTCNAVIAVI